jgi:WD40 repeat protein
MDQSVKLWSIEGQLIKTLNGHSAEVTSVCFSPDGKSIVSASEDSTIQFWSGDGTLLRTFNGHQGPVRSVCFSPNGKILVSSGEDRKIIMWNLDLENLLMRGCQWLQEYLKTNINVSEEDKRTCLGGCGWLYKYLKSTPPS